MNRLFAAMVGCVWCIVGTSVRADIISYWNFNTLIANTNNGTTYAPTSGSGLITLNVPAPGITAQNGSTLNALNSDPSGNALTIRAGIPPNNLANNGSTVTTSFSMTDFANPIFSFATTRTNNGFNSVQLSYSTNGTTFTNFGSAFDPTTLFTLRSFDLSAVNVLDNAPTVYLRLTLNGATQIAGDITFDNFRVEGNSAAVPEPGSLLLAGVAGALWFGRNRFRKSV